MHFNRLDARWPLPTSPRTVTARLDTPRSSHSGRRCTASLRSLWPFRHPSPFLQSGHSKVQWRMAGIGGQPLGGFRSDGHGSRCSPDGKSDRQWADHLGNVEVLLRTFLYVVRLQRQLDAFNTDRLAGDEAPVYRRGPSSSHLDRIPLPRPATLSASSTYRNGFVSRGKSGAIPSTSA